MENKNKEILYNLLYDMEDFARLKGIKCEPLYLVGGSGCIIAGYLDRATTDIDFIDINYPAKMGRLFKILESFDLIDLFVASIPDGFEKRAIKIHDFKSIDVYVLSVEDIIVSKIGRYNKKDKDDIKNLNTKASKKIVFELIDNVLNRSNYSNIAKENFVLNAERFKEDFNV